MKIFGQSRGTLIRLYEVLKVTTYPVSRNSISTMARIPISSTQKMLDHLVDQGSLKILDASSVMEYRRYRARSRKPNKHVKAWYIRTTEGTRVMQDFEILINKLRLGHLIRERF